jgi:2,3-bisphosphoglycerate-dependent phosphoglycerate mutase
VLIAAHGNSLRAIVKHLFDVPDDKIVGVEIPTGNPLEIDLDAALKPTSARYLDERAAMSAAPAAMMVGCDMRRDEAGQRQPCTARTCRARI